MRFDPFPRVKVSGLPSAENDMVTSPPLIVCPPGPLLLVSVAVIFGGSGGLQEARRKSPVERRSRVRFIVLVILSGESVDARWIARVISLALRER